MHRRAMTQNSRKICVVIRASTDIEPIAPSASIEIEPVSAVVHLRPKIADEDFIKLGKSGLTTPVIGIGAWSWGDKSGYWGQSSVSNYGEDEAR